MNTKKKSIVMRIVAATLSVFMLAMTMAMLLPHVAAADAEENDEYLSYPITSFERENAYNTFEPIPLLMIQVSFDPNGNGIDDNADGSNTLKVKDAESEIYGEQWSHSNDADWSRLAFDKEGSTLYTYYQMMSSGKFCFTPVEETYGTENDSVVHVTIKGAHLATQNGWVYFFKEAIKQASEYVDFAAYDKNKNGVIDKYELGILFIAAGYESSCSSATELEIFGHHAYYKEYVKENSIEVDGVLVGQSGFSCIGEYQSKTSILNVGTWAHELGHYLGLPDLYDTDKTVPYYPIVELSLMANGSNAKLSHFDPYCLLKLNFYEATGIGNGEYTVYSKASTEGKYQILKINTPNPGEYYLIENRYFPSDIDYTYFDGNISGYQKGILIYHIDEKLAGNSMKINTSKYHSNPAVVAYNPLTKNVVKSQSPQAFRGDAVGTYADNYKVFKASDYKFVEGTWYTSLTAEEAELCKDLKIEILSGVGTEMKIRVTGAYEAAPAISTTPKGETKNSVTIGGKIDTLNGTSISDMSVELFLNKTSVGTKDIKVKKDGTFDVTFEGLEPGKLYNYKVTANSPNGEGVTTGYTSTYPDTAEKTNYTIYIYKGLRENEKPSEQKVKFGEKFTYSFPMTKSGYAFVGWYTDEALTQKFDMNFTQDEANDFSIYAKWVPSNEAATLKFSGATVTNKVFSVLVGEKFTVPEVAERENDEFLGWYTDENFTTPFDFDAATTAAGTTTIYAKWKSSDETKEPTQSTSPIQTEPVDTDPVDPGEDNKSSSTGVIIAVVAVVVVVIAAVAVVIVIKNKKKDNK